MLSYRKIVDGHYLKPDDPDYDRQVLRISRQITYVTTVPISSYPGMTVSDAVAFEHEAEMSSVVEGLMWVEGNRPGQSLDLRTHVDVLLLLISDVEKPHDSGTGTEG